MVHSPSCKVPIYIVMIAVVFVLATLACLAPPYDVVTPTSTSEPECKSGEVDYSGTDPRWSYLTIEIGATSKSRLVERLGLPTRISPWPPAREESRACIYQYNGRPGYPAFWVMGNTVVALELHRAYNSFDISGLPLTQAESKKLYGTPFHVGWSQLGVGVRSAAWPEEGVLADIYVGGRNLTTRFILFTPITTDEFTDSLWDQLVLDYDPSFGGSGDVIDGGPQNPFEWEVETP